MKIFRPAMRALSVEGAAVVAAFVIMVVFFSLKSSVFLTSSNLSDMFVEGVFTILITVGMTSVLLVGGIDLSVGANLGLSGGIAYLSLLHGAPVWVAVIVGVAVGALIGMINGIVISGLQVNAFIVTLAMLSIVAGVLDVVTDRVTLSGAKSSSFSTLATGSVLGVPLPVVVCLIIVILLELTLTRTPFGRSVYATGMNPRAALLAGVPVRRIRFLVYVLSGATAGVAGVIQASRLNSVQAGLGSGYELTAIAAAVIGGTSLAGGRGTIWRGAVGALFLETLSRGLQLLGVDPLWFTIVTGASIILAISFDRVMGRLTTHLLRNESAPSAELPNRSSREPAITRG
jgi:ribose transport system permease protein